jgi:exodeoxyribonuclease VII small subunit
MMKSFEERLQRLESIGESLRDGTLPLDTASKMFEEGLTLARTLDSELRAIEKRVEILTSETTDTEEPPVFELFPELTDRQPGDE